MRRRIASGDLEAGQRLPSVRTMAEQWKCTPNTVSRAYSMLAQEGLVSAHRGGGTRVIGLGPPIAESTPPEWRWAALVNRAEGYLLEALGQGHEPAHAEAALAAAISRWQELRRRFPSGGSPSPEPSQQALRFSGSHDLCVELLARSLAEQASPVTLATDFVGSLGGLIALARGEADLAGAHLWDEAGGQYNVPFVQRIFPNRPMVLLNLVQRMQGLIVPEGNPQGLKSVRDLAAPDVRLVNRQAGSGTRVLLDLELKAAGLASRSVIGYDDEETTHMGAARAVAEGRATVALGISAAANAYGLDFVALSKERYDLVVPFDRWESRMLLAVRVVLGSERFKAAMLALGGYDVSDTGTHTLID